MAAPFITGILALNLAEYPGDGYRTQIERLVASSQPVSGLRFYSRSGGIVNLEKSLRMDIVPIPPEIVAVSDSRTIINEGETAKFWVTATSDQSISYQWFLEDEMLSGETNSELTVENATLAKRGRYTCKVSSSGVTLPVVFELVVRPRMHALESLIGNGVKVFASHEDHWALTNIGGEQIITNKEVDNEESVFLHFHFGEKAMLRFTAKRLEDSWYPITLAGPSLYERIVEPAWAHFDVPADQDSSMAELEMQHWNYGASPDANAIYLKIPKYYEEGRTPPYSAGGLVQRTERIGAAIVMLAQTVGSDIHIQWYKDGVLINGANDQVFELEITSESDAGLYYAEATNEHGSIVGQVTEVIVDTSPEPARFDDNTGVFHSMDAGEPFVLEVKATGTPPIQYQWYREDVPIIGANGPKLELGPAQIAHSENYSISIQNEQNQGPFFKEKIVTVNEQIFPLVSKRM